MREKPKKKSGVRRYAPQALGALCGFGCGMLIAGASDELAERLSLTPWLTFWLLFCGFVVILFLHILIHEAGHLVFGLLTGYRFSSFRIGSLMWVRIDGKLRFRRYALAGTGGQCLMGPPEWNDGKMPCVLYNLGGSLMNLAVGVACLAPGLLLRGRLPLASVLLLISAAAGLFFAAINGIPMRTGAIDNDGRNAMSLGGNPDALRAFWVQLKVNEQMAQGVRLRNMPEKWFVLPDEEQMKNGMNAVVGVFACNRLMDEHRFAEADGLMARLLEMDSAIVGIHKNQMLWDRLYCELIGENRPDVREALRGAMDGKIRRAMRRFPSVLRMEYAFALLAEGDEAGARKLLGEFERVARTYPYSGELESEREMMEIAKARVA